MATQIKKYLSVNVETDVSETAFNWLLEQEQFDAGDFEGCLKFIYQNNLLELVNNDDDNDEKPTPSIYNELNKIAETAKLEGCSLILFHNFNYN